MCVRDGQIRKAGEHWTAIGVTGVQKEIKNKGTREGGREKERERKIEEGEIEMQVTAKNEIYLPVSVSE